MGAAGPLIGAGLGSFFASGAGGLFGGGANGSALSQSQLGQLRGGIRAGGLSSMLVDENRSVQVTASPERQRLIKQLSKVFRGQARELGKLRKQVTPGFGRLSEVRREGLDNTLAALAEGRDRSIANIRATQQQALGDLRSQLGKRRIQGSSFAAGQEAALADRFGRAQADVEAENAIVAAEAEAQLSEKESQAFLQELGLNVGLLNQQRAAKAQAFQVGLDELNLQANMAMGILTSSNAGVAQLSSTAAQIQGQLMQDILGGIASGATFGGLGLGRLFGNLRQQPAGGGP